MKRIILLTAFLFVCFTSWAQLSVTTVPPLANNNGAAGITLEVESSSPIIIKDIDVWFNSGNQNVTVWYRIGGVQSTTGVAPTISTANGWVQHMSGATANGTGSGPVPISNFTDLAIPANTPVGIAIDGNMSYDGSGSTPTVSQDVFTDGTLTLRTGVNYGYGGGSPNPPNHPRNFLGTIHYQLDIIGNCNKFTNLLIDSITDAGFKVNWTPGTGNTSFYFEYGPAGFTPGNGTQITGTYPGASQPPIYVTGLTQLTDYDIYIGEICNSGSDSAYFPAPITITTMPSCPDPDLVTLLAANSGGATFDIQSANTAFDYEIGPTGFVQGTGTIAGGGNPLVVSGLLPNTCYDVYVRSNCTATGDGTSGWIGPVTFCTTCLPQSLPFLEDFTNGLGCFQAIDGGAGPETWEPQPAGGGAAGGDLDGTAYVIVNSDAHGNGVYMREMLVSAPIDAGSMTAGASLILEFDQFYEDVASTDSGFVEVYDGTQWHIIYQVGSGSVGAFGNPDHQVIDVTQYANANFQIRFVYDDGNTWAWWWALDNISVEEVLCAEPTNVHFTTVGGTTANISMTSGGTTFNFEYGPAGFVQGTGTTVTGGTNHQFTGLTSNTCYDVYIQNDCNAFGNGTSNWIGPYTFCTTCLTQNLPFLEDFNNSLGCFTATDGGATTETWRQEPAGGTTVGGDLDGSGFAVVNGTITTFVLMDEDLTSAPIDAGSLAIGHSLILEFDQAFSLGIAAPVGTVEVFDGTQWNEVYSVNTNAGALSAPDHVILDVTQHANANFQVRFNFTDPSTWLSYWAIDNVSVQDIACADPLSASVTNITPYTATLAFNSGGTNFDFEYGPAGFVQGTGTVVSGSNPFTITGLSPATTYHVYIRNNCTSAGNGTSGWIGPISFTTTCIETAMPYYESFDVWPLPCIDTTGGVNYWRKFNGPAGDNYAEADFWGISLGEFLMTTQPIIVDKKAQIRFQWSHLYDPNYNDQFQVEVQKMSTGVWDTVLALSGPAFDDPTAGNSNTPGEFINEIVFLDSATYVGDTIRVRLRAITDFGPDLFVNDLHVEEVPACPPPTKINIGILTSSSAEVGVTGLGTTFEYEYGPVGFSPGTGVIVSGGNPMVITGLQADSTYDVYARSRCGTDSSTWEGPLTFTTLCAPLTAPYIWDFEQSTVGFFNGFDNCWNIVNKTPNPAFVSSGYAWEVRNTAQVTSTGTGPDRDNTLAPSMGGHFVTADVSYGLAGDSTMLVSPLVDISGLTNPELEFYFHMHGSILAELHVDIFDGSSWNMDVVVLTQEYQTSPSQAYRDTTVDLSQFNADTVQVRFRAISNGCCAGDVAIDDIRISNPPTCPAPDNLEVISAGATTAKLDWDPGTAGNMNYEVAYGQNLSSPGGGTHVIVTTGDSLDLTGLMSSSGYCYFVREICAPGDTSFWSGPACFNTACVTAVAPYMEDFEGHTVGFYNGTDACWDIINTVPSPTSPTAVYSWEVRNTVQTSSSGTGPDRDNTLAPAIGGKFVTADVSYGLAGDSTILLSPMVDISNLTNPELKYFFHMWGAAANMAELHIDIFDGTNWNRDVQILTQVSHSSASQAYRDTSVDLSQFSADTVQVRFRGVSRGCCAGDIAIDDISIDNGPACPAPGGFRLASSTGSSATLAWNAGGSAQSYNIVYGVPGFNPATAVPQVVTTNSITIGSLLTNIPYDAYLQAYCGGTDTSIWVGPLRFGATVPCDDFEGYSTGAIDGQSTLFLGWDGAGGDGEVSTAQAQSGTQSLHIHDSGSNAFSDIVAYFDTKTSGTYNIEFAFYIPTGDGGYYNILHDYAGTTSVWAIEVYLDAGGTAQVDMGTNATGTIGTYNFNVGQWNTVEHMIDLDNDTAWILVNGVDANVGWQFSLGSTNKANQFNGVNFYSAANTGQTPNIYFDDFCVTLTGGCPKPTALLSGNVTCTGANLSWTSGTAGAYSIVEYGPAGFTPGSVAGTVVFAQSPVTLSSLMPGTAYDFYVQDTCGADTSMAEGPVSFTTANGPLTASFTSTMSSSTATSQTFDFDASGSAGATSYSWNFGDGSPAGTGVSPSHTYTTAGNYTVTLTITGPCGTTTSTSTVMVNIGLEENILSRSLTVYPNPTNDVLNISFTAEGSENVTIRITDLSGKTIREIHSSDHNGKFEDRISLRDLAKGLYLLKVRSGNMTAVRSIVRQ